MQGSTKLTVLYLQFCTALLTVQNLQFCTALHTLLMMTAEFMLSKRPVLRFTAALFFLLKLFSSHIYGIQIKFISQLLSVKPEIQFNILLLNMHICL